MRVWVLTNEYEPWIIGGLGVVATRLSRALADLDLDVTVFARGHGDPKVRREHHVTVLRFPKRAPYYRRDRRRYRGGPILSTAKHLHLDWPDVVHVHSVGFTNLASRLQRRTEIPVVYTCHSLVHDEPPSRHKSMIMQRQERLLTIADRITVPSEWQRQGLIAAYPHCADKVIVIPNGVDVPEEVQPVNRMATRKEDSAIRLLFAGRLVENKGIEPLLYAVALLRQRGLPVILDVFGRGSHNYEMYLKKTAQRLKIAKYVRWCGLYPHHGMADVYACHDLMVVPSHGESFGLVALEAMAYGVPLVATQSGGLSDFVDAQVAAIIPRVEGDAIADAIWNAVNQAETMTARVLAGRSRAAQYTWASVAQRYHELFANLIHNLGRLSFATIPRQSDGR